MIALIGCSKKFTIASKSMEPTFKKGDQAQVAYRYNSPADVKRFDIIIFFFKDASGRNKMLLQRVVGLPRECLYFTAGAIYINRSQIIVPPKFRHIYRELTPFASAYEPYTIPENCFFVIGDNINYSMDSRFLGCVPFDNILGKVNEP
jgi:signal peptidase I